MQSGGTHPIREVSETTKKEKQKVIKNIVEGAYIIDNYGAYLVTKIYPQGVQYQVDWHNCMGYFYEYRFITYDELVNDENWKEIII